jgi:hypothetical protein
LVVVSRKEEREKKRKRVWRQFCEWLSEAAAHLPTAVSLLLLQALFMQISGVSLTLTWPLRLYLLRVLLGATATATSFPLSKHTGGGDTAPTFSGWCVYFSLYGKWAFPPSCGVFLPQPPLLQAFLLLVAEGVLLLLPSPALFIYSSLRDFPSPALWCSGHPALFATCLFCCYCLLFNCFSFFPWVGVSLSRGLC